MLNPRKTKDGSVKQIDDFFDFFEMPLVQEKERIKLDNGRAAHPNQKPEKLLEIIIAVSSDEGDIVLDPFFGIGTTGVVCKLLKRNFIGIEIDPVYFEIAKKRIGEEKPIQQSFLNFL